MIDRYSSLAGMVQIVFIISLVILVLNKWNAIGIITKIFVIIGLSLFTIIQPIAFWINAGKAIDPNMPENEISFDDDNMIIKVNSFIQKISYIDIVTVINKPKLLIVQPDQKHIYILPSRVLGKEKKELYEYLKTKVI